MTFTWIPNAICVVRVLLVWPIVISLLEGRYLPALILIVVAGASDVLDGFLARNFGWRTRIGGLLDPAADKLLVTSAFISLAYTGLVPIGITLIVIGRDLVIVGGALAYQFVAGNLRGEPTLISKLNTACQLGFVVLTTMNAGFEWPPSLLLLLLGAVVVFTSITSGLNYVVLWTRRTRDAKTASA